MSDPKIAIELMAEKLITLDNKVAAAHQRMDKFELYNTETLKEIKDNVKSMQLVVVELSAFMHRSRGWGAAFMFLIGLVSTWLIDKVWHFLPNIPK